MSWIKTIPYESSSGYLRTLYDRVKGPDNNVDNIMMAHSLRPHTMDGHMVIYKNVLHHYSNSLPKWFLETIGVWVSLLNQCDYCVEHHFAGLKRLLNDDDRCDRLRQRLETSDIESLELTPREKLALTYARQLTLKPAEMDASLVMSYAIADLRTARSWKLIRSLPISIMPTGPYLGWAHRLTEIFSGSHRATPRIQTTGTTVSLAG